MVDYPYHMEELPNIQPTMRCVWNRNKTIPATSVNVITITLDTSVEVGSIKEWLLSSLTDMLQVVATQTGAKEQLISIETTKL